MVRDQGPRRGRAEGRESSPGPPHLEEGHETPGTPSGGPKDVRGEWPCPGVSAHPVRAVPECQALDWDSVPQGRYRAVEHTCSCRTVFYELVSCGGAYMIHRVVQGSPPEHAFTGRWRVREAREMWHRVLTGQAR
ncbi:hypothetical protein [Streptosporangium sp. V21-05]|uniref:hypothetical protein n=1 Tax=Streptosporangium sp. V21-05 TaxID=3446115 RepID=UPI003F53162D